MKAALIQILMGAIGTLGFSIYFRVSERNVAAATFGGALGWGVYLLCFHLWGNVFAANVVATAVVYFWSVAMARVLKAPSNTYLIPGIIPLLPGGPLHYTMAGPCSPRTVPPPFWSHSVWSPVWWQPLWCSIIFSSCSRNAAANPLRRRRIKNKPQYKKLPLTVQTARGFCVVRISPQQEPQAVLVCLYRPANQR